MLGSSEWNISESTLILLSVEDSAESLSLLSGSEFIAERSGGKTRSGTKTRSFPTPISQTKTWRTGLEHLCLQRTARNSISMLLDSENGPAIL
ncbi:hypothetical protein CYMTET_8310 [Cymbomonas tetramitiformis]|uniref:Uncharacterized protein n=1 Tax=Cymbomonas tetramitiformis TaxID=36881 RepID=A0AAE0GTA9_9CHLO|nr:hypothetical protein CYMTET_8310 [Cymbomonas tetramitiformis]